MAITDKPWDGSASRWPDTASYCKCCLIDTNPSGQDKIQANCKLPYCEPNGDINKNALGSAAAALAGARNALTGVTPAQKKAAAKKLIGLYGQAQMPPPDSLKRIGGS